MPHEIEPHAPNERARQIIALAKDALDGVIEVRARIRRSTEAALECGRLLIEEKERVHKERGLGEWELYFEVTFSKAIPIRTAQHWMRQARNAIAPPTVDSEANRLRNEVLMLGLFPPKEHFLDPSEVGPHADEPLRDERKDSHLSLINRVNEWILEFNSEVEAGRIEVSCIDSVPTRPNQRPEQPECAVCGEAEGGDVFSYDGEQCGG